MVSSLKLLKIDGSAEDEGRGLGSTAIAEESLSGLVVGLWGSSSSDDSSELTSSTCSGLVVSRNLIVVLSNRPINK